MTRRILAGAVAAVDVEADATCAVRRLETEPDWDVILLDVGMPGLSGFQVLERHRQLGLLSSVVMVSGDNTAVTAAECLRAGAFDYVTKPFDPDQLIAIVRSAARHVALRRGVVESTTPTRRTAAPIRLRTMGRIQGAIDRLAASTVSVLIQGESGTGKELVARTLHDASPRRGGPFVALNCGAIPETLIDSELFGHSRGAFTGATGARAGVFLEADGGTLFLDEIGEMPLAVQARLLRVLQEGEVRAVGGQGVRTVDVRVIAATHVDLHAAVAEGRFRQDLYYRLNVVTLALPPLRERIEDLPALAAHFLVKHGGGAYRVLSPAALEALAVYDWPGNIRELENAVLHALALTPGDELGVEALPARIRSPHRPSGGPDDTDLEDGMTLTDAKRRAANDFEKRYLLRLMERSRGSVSEGARQAGIDRANLRRLLQRHGIDPARYRA